MSELSVLASQRERDGELCGWLVRNSGYRDERGRCVVDPDLLAEAATRIRELSEDLKQACHDRDRYQAEVERMGWRPIETAPMNEPVLLAWKNRFDGEWVVESGYAGTGERFPSGYSNVSLHGSATHWQPLPPPPGEK